ncbi:uncharacterized protein [Nicotiana sylvestris]|uniref:uncharacterized protein n=1 Tax=Nicotiana sylvestris TaxID=4096 RepID=UPI00388CC15A
MFDGTGNPKVHLRTYCEKLIGVGKDKRIHMKLFMRSLTGDTLSWYISQNPNKWVNWVSMASDFMDRFRFNIENTPDTFYIQNLKKKPTKTFREYATRWRSEAAKVSKAMEEEHMNKFFVRAQDPLYYERLIVIENHKFSDIIKLGERTEEGIKSGIVTNFEALQAKNKALQLGGISKKKEVGAVMVAQEVRRKGKGKMEKTGAAQGMTRTGMVYMPEHLGGTSKEAAPKPPIIETGLDDLWRKVKAREYSVVDHLNKTPAQISILSLLQNSEVHRNALIKVLNEAYVPNNITSREMANMVGQVLESHKITFHEDKLPPKGLSHNRALYITVQFEDKFIVRVLIDGGSSLNSCSLTTLKKLGKGLHEIRAGTMNMKAFDGYQRATIGEINLYLQMPNLTFQQTDVIWGSEEDEALASLRNLFLDDEGMDYNAIVGEEEEEEDLTIWTVGKGVVLKNWTTVSSWAR